MLTETWFNCSLPRAVTPNVAPAGYAVAHIRIDSVEVHEGGVSVIYRNPGVRPAVVEMKSLAGTTDRMVLKLITQRGRVNLAAVYRPPSIVVVVRSLSRPILRRFRRLPGRPATATGLASYMRRFQLSRS